MQQGSHARHDSNITLRLLRSRHHEDSHTAAAHTCSNPNARRRSDASRRYFSSAVLTYASMYVVTQSRNI